MRKNQLHFSSVCVPTLLSHLLCVETHCFPPPPPPLLQQWESGGVWVPSILRATGVNSSGAPGIRIEEEIELCLPPTFL